MDFVIERLIKLKKNTNASNYNILESTNHVDEVSCKIFFYLIMLPRFHISIKKTLEKICFWKLW